MNRGLDNMQDLDAALSKSLDDMIRQDKANSRGRGRGRGRGRERGRGRGRGQGRRQSTDRDQKMTDVNGRGRFIQRNRYSAQQHRENTSPNKGNMRRGANRGGPRRGRIGNNFNRNMKRPVPLQTRPTHTVARRTELRRGPSSRGRGAQRLTTQRNLSTSGAVIVQGLLPHVTSDDIKEIFETIGVVTKAYVKFDGQTGKSTGVAEVVYAHRGDARRAQRELNGKLIDQAPITVRLAFESSPLGSRTRPMKTGFAQQGHRRTDAPRRAHRESQNPLQR